ncbi:type 1 glutamine amidotransferase domain-containing protein [Pseudoalteromonas piscicida]|uniref:Type 1 glutamine amidotransferase domain-containing protein n=1 Tax=Pseudoalteromonas piscicida TaxID=43662 RepID=A0AAQ2EYB2_PSEO7|nr:MULTISPECIES: type 1 glutamine amidotransferase domain-containing protein [Pseudoalteromonas]KJY92504.1 dimethylallyltransferase [Pseudoalteromonas piscicida]TMN38197.1 type 1 glutamine amidotransferase domain-containing protein [Pseudoalteromonas piscicida]TMN39532.1 type 1 glutamine amidotransferase domain-containing protein [Pseudoalteromonas piscicida]TMN50305.1 type 1 glutamine amidotransferase domain-containing protein [Pseudoalteromonas piscicida]TMN52523.1 type 1 glutamine amidotran
MTAKKILMVLTSHAELGDTGEKTGFWIEEFAAPYYAFVDAGVEVTLASPKGGQPPIDPKSEQPDFQTDSTTRYFDDQKTQELVANTLPLAEVNAAYFDAVFYPGGHGPLWDLATDANSIQLISSFLAADKPVGAVCHATAVLMDVKATSGEYLVKGKVVSGFTNSEEAAVGLTDVVPFLLEDELVKRGADFQKVDDWNVFAVRDGLIFTGQNPASSELVAEKMLTYLNQL